MSDFQDFTVAERKLWQDILHRPFDDWQIVLRWALSSVSFSYVQDMDIDNVRLVADLKDNPEAKLLAEAPLAVEEGSPEPPGYNFANTLQGITDALAEEGKLTEELALLSALLEDQHSFNAVMWIWEVARSADYENTINLRREVCNQLQAEITAAGDCSTYLCFLVWVLRRREPGKRETWSQWAANEDGQKATDEGIKEFMRWRAARRKIQEAEKGAAPSREAVPLEQEEDLDPPMSGV